MSAPAWPGAAAGDTRRRRQERLIVNGAAQDDELSGSVLTSLRAQCRIILALFLRETRTRYGKSMIGYTWALLEPMFQIALWSALFIAMDRRPPIGDSMTMFVLTAFIPLMMFRNLSSQLTNAIVSNRALLYFPVVTNTDVIFGRAFLEVVTIFTVAIIFFAGLWLIGLDSIPQNPVGALIALISIAFFGTGFGFCNAVIATQIASWPKFVGWINRIAFLTCGIFFLPQMLPIEIQKFLKVLPLTHAVDWFRATFFFGYKSDFYHIWYIFAAGAWCMFMGFAMERVLRRKIVPQ